MTELWTHSGVWQRVHAYRSATPSKGKWVERWESDTECAIRMRGYAELVFGNLTDKMRKKIDTALKRGYALENRTQLPHLLGLIERHNPIQKLPIGYIGKSEFNIYVPTVEDAQDLRKEIIATNAMVDGFKGNKVQIGGNQSGYHCVFMHWAQRKDADDDMSSAPHLKPCFTKIRPCIDSWLEGDAAVREQIARWCAKDDCTIRIPFDSHKKRRKT